MQIRRYVSVVAAAVGLAAGTSLVGAPVASAAGCDWIGGHSHSGGGSGWAACESGRSYIRVRLTCVREVDGRYARHVYGPRVWSRSMQQRSTARCGSGRVITNLVPVFG